MTYDINICFAYKTKNEAEQIKLCRTLLDEVIKRLMQQGKTEFDSLGKIKDANDIYNADFIIGNSSHPDFQVSHIDTNEQILVRPIPAVVLLSDDNWDKNVNAVSRNPLYDVRAIFRASRLLRESPDLEEFGQFSEVIKNLLRDVLRKRGLKEEDFSKPIDWKVSVNGDCGTEFISLFSTPSMQKMARKYKDALLSLDDPILRKLRGTIRESLDLKKRCIEIKNFFWKNIPDNVNSYRVPSVLLLGETGCGKSLLSSIAANVIMPDKELTKINISSYNKESIDLMLFGAEKGSYTDSDRDRMGVFIGHCGEVVFLDEIGDMDIETQTHLLTYMDNGQVMPRGMTSTVCSPCILIAATNKDVNNDSTFRKDILNRFEHVIKIPPIRERKQDMRLLISMLLQNDKLNPLITDIQHKVQRISLDAIKYLEDREYSGNFRELKFRISQAVNSAFLEGNSCLCLRHFLLANV